MHSSSTTVTNGHHIPDVDPNWEQFLVERSVDGVIVVDGDGCIRSFNPAAEQIFRTSGYSVRGSAIERFVPARFHGNHRQLVASVFTGPGTGQEMREREPVPAQRADGEEFFADIALIPIVYKQQPAVACVVRDLTDRMNAESAALQAEKLESLRLLSAGLAHDFNNILTTIIGNAEIAASMVGDESPAFLSLYDIKQAGERAAEMVQQMLRFAGRGDSLEQTDDVSTLVLDMCRLLRGSLRPNVAAVTDVAPELPAVRGDPTSIRQIVMNLVVNASEAMGETPGQITVSASAVRADRRTLRACYGSANAVPGDFVAIEVADTGPGMDRETRARVFDPFFSTKFAGRGLGLASVLGIVRSLGGGIRLTSRPGKGSTFRVLLPVAAPDSAAEAAE